MRGQFASIYGLLIVIYPGARNHFFPRFPAPLLISHNVLVESFDSFVTSRDSASAFALTIDGRCASRIERAG